MWANESIFYHIYPLGFCNTPERNSFSPDMTPSIYKIENALDHMKNMGMTAVYMGPVFESTAHGYDTADYYQIDSRLGTNEDFAVICKKIHENGQKIILDGVFNHVGRDFWAFKDVQKNKGYSPYVDWFHVHWDCNNHYNDGFCYDGWEGCTDLVKLNLKHPHVKSHVLDAVKFWIEKFDIDGLRLDVAYCLDKDFLKELRSFCKSIKPDFWLMGETLHGDYNQWMNDVMLDSVTNYECYKGLFSSCNDKNMFEIAHSIKRQETLYQGKHMYTFLDNHDVSRIASSLKDKKDLKLIYTLLYAMPGIPSVYYGSEFGLLGDKSHGDKVLRPCDEYREYNDLTHHIQNLSKIYKDHKCMSVGNYSEVKLVNEIFCFTREFYGDKILCCINISDNYFHLNHDNQTIHMPPKSAQVFSNGECISSVCG